MNQSEIIQIHDSKISDTNLLIMILILLLILIMFSRTEYHCRKDPQVSALFFEMVSFKAFPSTLSVRQYIKATQRPSTDQNTASSVGKLAVGLQQQLLNLWYEKMFRSRNASEQKIRSCLSAFLWHPFSV